MVGEALTRSALLVSVALSALLSAVVGLGGLAMADAYPETYTNIDAAGTALFSFVLGMIVALSLVPKALARGK